MKFTVMLSRRKVVALLFVLALLASSFYAGVQYTLAQGGILTGQTLSSGVYPGAPSYTIWTEGGYTYAKNAYGVTMTAWTSTNFLSVVNPALATGHQVKLKDGTYSYSGSISISTTGASLIGETSNGTILNELSATSHAITITPVSGYIEDVKVSTLTITGPSGSGYALYVNGTVTYSKFSDLRISGFANGMVFNGTYTTRGIRHTVENIHISDCSNAGVWLIEQDGHTLNTINIQDCATGVIMEEITQGITVNTLRIDQMTANGIYIKGQGIHVNDAWISECDVAAVGIFGGSSAIYFDNLYAEASGAAQVLIQNNVAFDIYDIKFMNSRLVRGDTNGVKIVGDTGKSVYDVTILGCSIVNNGQTDGAGGIYAYNNTRNVIISDSFIGNNPLDSSATQGQAIGTDNVCANWTVTDNDVSTSRYNDNATFRPYLIDLAGTGNKISDNYGFINHAQGSITIANDEDVPHTLANAPTNVMVTSQTSNIGGQPVIVSVTSVGATTFRVGAIFANGTYIVADSVPIYWDAFADP